MAGGRIGVTKEDVFKACENLIKNGVDVTNSAVRRELGAGSYTTIAPLAEEWRKNHAKQESEKVETPSIPTEVSTFALKFADQLWAEASLIHFKKVAELEKSHTIQLEKLTTELSNKNTELQQLQTDIQKLESSLEASEKGLDQVKNSTLQKDGEITLLKEQLSGKDIEIKTLLERAIRAEKDLESQKKK